MNDFKIIHFLFFLTGGGGDESESESEESLEEAGTGFFDLAGATGAGATTGAGLAADLTSFLGTGFADSESESEESD